MTTIDRERLIKCTKCLESKPTTEFYKRYTRSFYSWCKNCLKIQARIKYANNPDKHNARTKKHRQTEQGKRTVNTFVRKAAERYPDKTVARQKLRYAVSSGRIRRSPCQECGDPKVQGHHYLGYDEAHWYDVKWLCDKHHKIAHNFNIANRPEGYYEY